MKSFFTRLAATAEVKKKIKSTKTKKDNEKHDTKQHKKKTNKQTGKEINKKETNWKTTIYEDRYILHPDTDSLGDWKVNCCSSNLPCSLNNVGNHRLSKKNNIIKYSDQLKLEAMKFKIIDKC